MVLVICGSRSLVDVEKMVEVISKIVHDNAIMVTEVVSGGARGADYAGEQWARRKPVYVYK